MPSESVKTEYTSRMILMPLIFSLLSIVLYAKTFKKNCFNRKLFTDINECENLDEEDLECEGGCTNTIGSYLCQKAVSESSITCPDDIVTELGPGEMQTEIELDRPTTHLDWETYVVN